MNTQVIRILISIIITMSFSNAFSQNTLEIYTMPGCGRCAFTKEYVKEHNIPYTEYSTENDEHNSKMWNLLQKSGKYNGGSVTMPVIAYQGNVYFNIDDLEGFLSNLGGNQVSNNQAKTGCLSGNCSDGYGVFQWENNDTYAGGFKNGNLSGKGKYTWANGAYFDGEWANSSQNGYGVYVDENGNKTAGNWTNGQFIGAVKGENTNEVVNNEVVNYESNQNLTSQQIKEFVDQHNLYRAEVNETKLSWSNELANYAQEWANHLTQTGCEMEHRPRSGKWAQKYGENIFWCMGYAPTPTSAVESWASEKPLFDGGVINDKNMEAGHYTQMIWAKTTQVGCAIAKCSDGAYIIVCNYNPAGNYWGESPYGK